MIDTIEHYILMPVWMTLKFIESQLLEKKNIFALFRQILLQSIWIGFRMPLQTAGLLKLMPIWFCMVDVQGREAYQGDLNFFKYWCSSAHILTNFKQTWYDDKHY